MLAGSNDIGPVRQVRGENERSSGCPVMIREALSRRFFRKNLPTMTTISQS